MYVPMGRGQRAEDGIKCPTLAHSAPFFESTSFSELQILVWRQVGSQLSEAILLSPFQRAMGLQAYMATPEF